MSSPYTETVIPPEGIVSLDNKQTPICDRNHSTCDQDYCYTRGIIDTSNFKQHLLSLPSSIWDDKYQEGQGNVNLIRPAHDKWGIKKIIFTFCDDFLQKVFDLPWSKHEQWREHLLPIYNKVGISEQQVVRSLLASMPPGISIPVHHDTGIAYNDSIILLF